MKVKLIIIYQLHNVIKGSVTFHRLPLSITPCIYTVVFSLVKVSSTKRKPIDVTEGITSDIFVGFIWIF